MLVQKSKKATEREEAHTDLYLDGQYIGYLMANKSKFAAVGENWNFVSKTDKFKSFYTKTKKEMINIILTFEVH